MRKAIFYLFFFLVIFCFLETDYLKASETDLVISEIMYDWPGSDADHEWIEVYNSSLENILVNEEEWRFFDGSNHSLNLFQGTTTIAVEEFFVLADDAEQFLLDYPDFSGTLFDTVINLSNSSSTISLSFDSGSTYPVLANYESAWGANGNSFSLEKIELNQNSEENNWQESGIEGGTPGLPNSIIEEPEILPPQAVANCPQTLFVDEEGNFDASNSTDPQNLLLSFLWDFSDGQTSTSTIATHAFTEINNYNISLTVSNGELEDIVFCLVEVLEPEDLMSDYWPQIIVSEFLPNPAGSDDEEWIELYNLGPETVDLVGFQLQDNSARVFTLSEDDGLDLILEAQEYLVLGKEITGISLNNTGGDSVKLFNPNQELLEQIIYEETALEDKSYARQDNNFLWTTIPTPGENNVFVINQPPQAKITLKSDDLYIDEKIIFSAEDSFDPEEEELEYHWDFGDGKTGNDQTEEHSYAAVGNYLVILTVKDIEGLEDEAELLINIQEIKEDEEIKISPIDFEQQDLIISEFMPNPVGSDDQEWIELYNASSKDISLAGWQIDDSDGGSKPHIFTEENILGGDFLVIYRQDSGLALNNSEDSVRLITPAEEIWQEVEYSKIPEGQSQAWDLINGEWFVSNPPSPGEENFNLIEPEIIYSIAEIKELEKNDQVIIQGVALEDVASSARSFYITDWDQEEIYYDQVAEIYFSKKDFPDIRKGDLIDVRGQISQTGFLPRVKIKTQEDIIVNNLALALDLPETINVEDLEDDLLGGFVTLQGTVVKKSGKNIYLATSENEESKIRVYADFDIKDLEIKKGAEIIVSGILTETDSGFKLLPLQKEDLLVAQVLGLAMTNEEYGNIDNNISTSTNQVASPTRQKQVKNILLFIIIGGIIIGVIYFVKIKKSKQRV